MTQTGDAIVGSQKSGYCTGDLPAAGGRRRLRTGVRQRQRSAGVGALEGAERDGLNDKGRSRLRRQRDVVLLVSR